MITFRRVELAMLGITFFAALSFLLSGLSFLRLICDTLLVVLAILYFGFSGFLLVDKKGNYLFHSIFSGICYSSAIVGVLFWINDLSGYSPLVLLSSILLLSIHLPFNIYKKNESAAYFKLQIVRSASLGMISIIVYLSAWL